jgi:hypothetical protein
LESLLEGKDKKFRKRKCGLCFQFIRFPRYGWLYLIPILGPILAMEDLIHQNLISDQIGLARDGEVWGYTVWFVFVIKIVVKLWIAKTLLLVFA